MEQYLTYRTAQILLYSFFSFWILLNFLYNGKSPSLVKQERLSTTFEGKITEKKITKMMHGTVILELNDSQNVVIHRKLFDSLEIGDSISKKATDTCVFLFRRASNFEQETLYHYFYDGASIEYGTCYCRKNDGVARYCHD